MKNIHKSLFWLCIALLPEMASASQETAIGEIFEPYNDTDSPSCEVSVYQNEQMAFEKTYGFVKIEESDLATAALPGLN